jgi:23S rRNA pseudouridine2605 synthase
MAAERLQKIMAAAGIASRRKAEEFIAAGRVTLNGKIVTEQGTKADPDADEICVDGQPLKRAEQLLYFMLNKPKGYVTTVSDPEGRPTVMEFVSYRKERLYPVGRLDYASEGLLLMTNDGDLAQKLTKAGSHVPKTYHVKISGRPDEKGIERLRRGITITLEDGQRVKTSPARIRLLEDAANPWYEVVLIEGRNRQIRRMFQNVGFLVEKIKRVQLGPLTLDVPSGKVRPLTVREVAQLKSLTSTNKEGGPNESTAVEICRTSFAVHAHNFLRCVRSRLEPKRQSVVGARAISRRRQIGRTRHGHRRLCKGRSLRYRPISESGAATGGRSRVCAVRRIQCLAARRNTIVAGACARRKGRARAVWRRRFFGAHIECRTGRSACRFCRLRPEYSRREFQ